MYKNTKKEDLLRTCRELGLEPPDGPTILQLKELIESSPVFKTEPEFIKDIIATFIDERKEQQRLDQAERELQLATLRNNPSATTHSAATADLESYLKSVKTLSMPLPKNPENFNLFFMSLEKAFTTKNVPDEFKSEILLNILGETANSILLYINQDEMCDYDKVKELILNHFQPNAQECLQNFRRSQRLPNETHIQFASRLQTSFEYYCKIRNVSDFSSLCELMVSDKLFSTLERETQSYISIRQNTSWFKPTELAKEVDTYFTSQRKSLSETNHRQQYYENKNKNNHHNYNRNKPTRGFPHRTNNNNFRSGQNSATTSNPRSNNNPSDNQVCTIETPVRQHELQFEDVFINNTKVTTLIDGGTQISCVHERYVPNEIASLGSVKLTGAFGNELEADLVQIQICLPSTLKNPITIIAAKCKKLFHDLIIPPNIFEDLLLTKNCSQEKSETLPAKEEPIFPRQQTELRHQTREEKAHALFLPSSRLLPASVAIETKSHPPVPQNVNNSESEDALMHNNGCFLFSLNIVPEDNDLSHISDRDLRKKLENIIQSYKPEKIRDTQLKMNIVLTDEKPVAQRARRLSAQEKSIVDKQINQWLADGVIQEKCSDFAAPLVLVKKKDNSTRVCVDYRALNCKTVKEKFPLPLIEDIFDTLQNATYFSALDLKNSFHHIDIEPESKKYTSFVTHNSQYIFKKVPFGLSNSPSIFQKYIQIVFKDLLKDNTVIIYLDDIIIFSDTEHEGLSKLQKVFEVASSYGLEFNFKKCSFLQRKITFLGHILEKGTIRPSSTKTKAVLQFPTLTSHKQIQSFLGLTSYFRKFIKDYALIARPLSDLLRDKVPFHFGPEQQNAFLTLKKILASEPVLHLFQQGAPLQVHCDASSKGYGAILMQMDQDTNFHPIYYMSYKTTPQEEKYSSYELEVLAIVKALKKFRHYLAGNKFQIFTDCQAFQKTMSKKDLPPRIARWALFLEEFDYEIIHRPGKQMQHVDALSRYPVMNIQVNEMTDKIRIAQSQDELSSTIKLLLEESKTTDYTLTKGVLYKLVDDRELLLVPQDLQKQIVQLEHAKGHFGITKTENLVKQQFYFPNMRKIVENVITNCVQCILSSKKSGKKEGLLNPIPKGDLPLDTYHIDFLGPLPSTNKNYKYIFTVVDAFTKFLWIYPVKSTSAHDALQKLQLQQATFGNPSRIISDKGSAFTSTEFQKYCQEENIELYTITTGVPRGNGQVEKFHATLIPVLAKLSIDDPSKWFKYVASVQRIINSTTSSTTKFTPFELLTGVKMKNKDDIRIKDMLHEENLQSTLCIKQQMREEAKKHILEVQEQSKRQYDKRRKIAQTYSIGDKIAIKRTQFGGGMKLRPKYFGPYEIVNVRPNDRYDVKKIGRHEGPNLTSTSADLMKSWNIT